MHSRHLLLLGLQRLGFCLPLCLCILGNQGICLTSGCICPGLRVPWEHTDRVSKDQWLRQSLVSCWRSLSSVSDQIPHIVLYPILSISPIFLKESTKKNRYRSGFGGMGDKFDLILTPRIAMPTPVTYRISLRQQQEQSNVFSLCKRATSLL